MEEKEYRSQVSTLFKKLENAFEKVDPDVVEFEFSQGSVILIFADSSRCILSTQPSVRQIWLAVASKGLGLHFDYDVEKKIWIDDKGKGLELYSFVVDYVFEKTGTRLS